MFQNSSRLYWYLVRLVGGFSKEQLNTIHALKHKNFLISQSPILGQNLQALSEKNGE